MSIDVLNRSTGNEALPRQVVKEGRAIGLEFPINSYMETSSEISVFDTGELKFMGHSFKKVFFAAGIGDDVAKIDSPNASGIFKFFGANPGHLNPEVDVVVGVLMDAALRVELEEKVADFLQSTDTSNQVLLEVGSTNGNQELKEDGKPGLIVDLSGLKLYKMGKVTSISIVPTETLGHSKNGMRFTLIRITSATTEQRDLPVCSAQSTSRGVYKLCFGEK